MCTTTLQRAISILLILTPLCGISQHHFHATDLNTQLEKLASSLHDLTKSHKQSPTKKQEEKPLHTPPPIPSRKGRPSAPTPAQLYARTYIKNYKGIKDNTVDYLKQKSVQIEEQVLMDALSQVFHDMKTAAELAYEVFENFKHFDISSSKILISYMQSPLTISHSPEQNLFTQAAALYLIKKKSHELSPEEFEILDTIKKIKQKYVFLVEIESQLPDNAKPMLHPILRAQLQQARESAETLLNNNEEYKKIFIQHLTYLLHKYSSPPHKATQNTPPKKAPGNLLLEEIRQFNKSKLRETSSIEHTEQKAPGNPLLESIKTFDKTTLNRITDADIRQGKHSKEPAQRKKTDIFDAVHQQIKEQQEQGMLSTENTDNDDDSSDDDW